MTPTQEDLRKRAYECWEERGCPTGSPDVDWWRAERELSATGRPERDGELGEVEMKRALTGGARRLHRAVAAQIR